MTTITVQFCFLFILFCFFFRYFFFVVAKWILILMWWFWVVLWLWGTYDWCTSAEGNTYIMVDYNSSPCGCSPLIQILVAVKLCGYLSFCMCSVDSCFTCMLCLRMVTFGQSFHSIKVAFVLRQIVFSQLCRISSSFKKSMGEIAVLRFYVWNIHWKVTAL